MIRVCAIGFYIIFFCSNLLAAERSICQIDSVQKTAIESCQKNMRSEMCQDIPAPQKIDCFDPMIEYFMKPLQQQFACAKGAKQGFEDTINAASEIAGRVKDWAFDNTNYKKRVVSEAQAFCEKDKDLIKAKENYKSIVKNIGVERAMEKYLPELRLEVQHCMYKQIQKGEAFGISFDFPKSEELKALYYCLNAQARDEMLCKIAVPMLAGGVTAAAIKTALKKSAQSFRFTPSKGIGKFYNDNYAGKIERAYNEYFESVQGKLTPKEIESLKHQKDILAAIDNPQLAKQLEATGVDITALVHGMLDSDYGKLASAQKLMMEPSVQSERFLNILKGKDKTSKAAQAYQLHMKSIARMD
jgi:hypothetical protein